MNSEGKDVNGDAIQLPPAVGRVINSQPVHEGTTIVARDGREYRAANIKKSNRRETLQIVRAVAKPKGKAARKADRKRRRLERVGVYRG